VQIRSAVPEVFEWQTNKKQNLSCTDSAKTEPSCVR